jgi:hypothetical protein
MAATALTPARGEVGEQPGRGDETGSAGRIHYGFRNGTPWGFR